jgi:hypothetical protein
LNTKPADTMTEAELADKFGRQQNHIWSLEELADKTTNVYKHKPVSVSDYFMYSIMRTMYHTFNFVTGYQKENPSVKSIEWRLIVLESVAGVPGFVAAGFRHLRSLRTISRDNGFIATLLEEAENERMHLLVCFKMFGASPLIRGIVIAAQALLTPALMIVYAIHPRSMHRFVGYLEETATEVNHVLGACEVPESDNIRLCFVDLHQYHQQYRDSWHSPESGLEGYSCARDGQGVLAPARGRQVV